MQLLSRVSLCTVHHSGAAWILCRRYDVAMYTITAMLNCSTCILLHLLCSY
jgi:hypothetical protein